MIRIIADHIISPLGFSSEDNYEAVLQGQSAIRQISESGLWPEPFFGAAFTPEQDKLIAQQQRERQLSKLEALSAMAVESVQEKSGIDITSLDTQLIIATTKGNIDLLSAEVANPNASLLNRFSENIAEYFHLERSPLLVSNACISGLLAIILAGRMLESEKAKNIIVVGGDLLTRFTLSGFQSFLAVGDEPCKPYDKQRNGISLGEGVGAVALTKSADDSLPKFISGATANDANHISGPSRTGEGLFLAAHRVLADSDEPGMISAHGTATPFNDEMECQAFNRLGLQKTPLHSLKGVYGHTLGAAGIIETIIGLRAMAEQKVLASVGYKEHGVTKPLNVTTKTEHVAYRTFLKTSSGFGGCNGAALFGL